MAITRKVLQEIHDRLQRDRTMCANSALAQAYLDDSEKVINQMASDLAAQAALRKCQFIADALALYTSTEIGRVGTFAPAINFHVPDCFCQMSMQVNGTAEVFQ